MQRFWNSIFSFSKDKTLAKIDYNKVETGLHISLKQCYCILGHCEQTHTYEYCLTWLLCKESEEELKNNCKVYTTQEGIR